MVVGSFVVAACLIVLGWAKELTAYFVEEGEFRQTCTIAVAVLAIYAVDFAINAGELGENFSTWGVLTRGSTNMLQDIDC
jgi:hypothetical protein